MNFTRFLILSQAFSLAFWLKNQICTQNHCFKLKLSFKLCYQINKNSFLEPHWFHNLEINLFLYLNEDQLINLLKFQKNKQWKGLKKAENMKSLLGQVVTWMTFTRVCLKSVLELMGKVFSLFYRLLQSNSCNVNLKFSIEKSTRLVWDQTLPKSWHWKK